MTRRQYYAIARKASSGSVSHPAFRRMQRIVAAADTVLDVGCGEGTRLDLLLGGRGGGVGVDVDKFAVGLARRQYPHRRFRLYSGRRLPFTDSQFDLVYSAFVVEHVQQPEQLLLEMIRVTRPGGQIVIWAPNYGAPSRRSPNSVENPYRKFLSGLVRGIFPSSGLHWTQVTPRPVYQQIDDDTVVEPYLHSLLRWLKRHGLQIEFASSWWQIEPNSANLRKLVLKLLGSFGVWPIKYWGPQLFLIATKAFR